MGVSVFDTNGIIKGYGSTSIGTIAGPAISAAGASAAVGTIVFSNSNGVSFGMAGSTVTATVVTNYLTTAMASNRGSDFVAATATISGANITGTIASNGMTLSVAAPGAGAAVTFTATNDSMTAGLLEFRNSNGVSFGIDTANSRLTATVATNYLTTAMASNRGSDFVAATATISGVNLTGTIASNGMTLSVAAPGAAAESNAIHLLGANTAGNTTASGSTIGWSAGNGLTLSGTNGSQVLISVGAYITTAMESNRGSDFVAASAAFAGTNALGTIASNGISISVGNYITTARASTDAIGLNTAATNVTWTVNSGGISLNASAYLTTAMASNAGSNFAGLGETVTTTAGTDLKLTVDSNGVNIAHPLWLTTAMGSNAGSNFAGLGETVTTTAGTDLKMTVDSAGVNVAHPVWITTAMASNAGSNFAGLGETVTTTAGTDLKLTVDSNGVQIAHPAWLTAAVGGANVVISGGTTDAALSNFSFANSNNVLWTLNGSTINALAGFKISASGSSVSGITNFQFDNSNDITFGLSGRTFTASHNPFLKAVQANEGGDIISTGTLQFNNTNGITFGVDTAANAVTASHNGLTTAAQSNHSHGNPTLALTNLTGTTASASDGFTLSLSAAAAAAVTMSNYLPPWHMSGMATNSGPLGNSSVNFMVFDLPYYLSASRINFYISLSGAMSNGNVTGSASAGIGYALYTLNSYSLSLLTSYSLIVASQSMSSNTQYLATHYMNLSDATSHSTSQKAISSSNASTYQATSVNGLRAVALPVNSVLTPGRYYLGMSIQSTSAGGLSAGISYAMTSVGVQPNINAWGTNSSATNASVFRAVQGFGFYSAATAAWPDTIPYTTNDIRAPVGQSLIHFGIFGKSMTTQNFA